MKAIIYSIIIINLALYSLRLVAQDKSDHNWILGYLPNKPEKFFGGVLLDFSQLNTSPEYFNIGFDAFGSSAISSKTGRLLAYTNGCKIMNSHHNVMDGGDTISYGKIWDNYCEFYYPIQGSLFLPWPSDTSKVILLHFKEDGDYITYHLLWTLIEFSEEYPSGKVIEKDNHILTQGASSLLTATRHGNGRDWWLILPEYKTNRYYTLLLDLSGISITDVQSIGHAWGDRAWSSQTVFSPDGKKFVRFNPWKSVDIMDFDRCNGTLSNNIESGPLTFPVQLGGGAAISPNSRFLYIANSFELYQYDLLASNVLSSRILIDTFDGYQNPFSTAFHQLMLAPDGKIYGVATSGAKSLHIIENPDNPGKSCNFVQHSMELPAYIFNSAINLPYYRLGPLDYSPCDSLGINNKPIADFRYRIDSNSCTTIHFKDLSYFNPKVYTWDFGDQTYSDVKSPIHYYQPGNVYNACLTVRNEFGLHYFCRTIDLRDSVTAVLDIDGDASFVLGPNPFQSELSIEIRDHVSELNFQLYTQLGEKAFDVRLNEKLNILNTSALTPGIYHYSLSRNGVIVKSGSLIKIR